MIVGVCGFGSTGSGAVVDFLREFPEEVIVGDNLEFSFLYDPDGILDLEHNLVKQPIRFYSGDAAIKKFMRNIYSYDTKRYISRFMSYESFKQITKKFIDSIIEKEYEGSLWTFDRKQQSKLGFTVKYILGGKYLRIFDKLHIPQPQKYFGDRMYLPLHDDERFYNAVKEYTSDLIKLQIGDGDDKKIIVLDQPFPTNNPSLCYSFFQDECKSIIVNRDPRDLYLISKMNPFGWELRFTPTNTVHDFITYYRDQMNILEPLSGDSLYVMLEDLIYKYDETAEKIKHFLGIKGHLNQRQFFDPKISIANTQMALRYQNIKEDIDIIENELSEYLYPFDLDKADLSVKPWNFK